MTSIHGPSGMRRFIIALVVAAVATAGATTVATPAHAEPDVVETTLSMTADPGTPGSAVLHAEMVGSYVASGGVIPAGTWSFLVADESGALLFETEVAQPAGGPTAIDVVWSDVPTGVAASGIVRFRPSESSESVEFAGATASFTSEGGSTEALDERLSQAAPTQPEAASAEPFTLGLGILVAASLLVAAVGVVLLFRRGRRREGGRI
jgi:hypothetical protein